MLRTDMFLTFTLLFLFILNLSAQNKNPTPTVGVIKHKYGVSDGYTLISPTNGKTDYLINNCGQIVHQWESDYYIGLSSYLLENGNVLRSCKLDGELFRKGDIGGRVEIHNWDNELVWGYNYSDTMVRQHHDITYMPNGHVLLLAWERVTREQAQALGGDTSIVQKDFFAETIVELAPIGIDSAEIVWKWRMIDHIIQDLNSDKPNYGKLVEYPQRFNIHFSKYGTTIPEDWVHANSVKYNADLDQILISSRLLSEIFIIDHSTTTAQAATNEGGKYRKGGDLLFRWGNPVNYNPFTEQEQQFFGQHAAHWIEKGLKDEGKIMVFNNGVGREGGDASSVDIINAKMDEEGNYEMQNECFLPETIDWTYAPKNLDHEFIARYMSSAQKLPNGNLLICEGNRGRIIEVNEQEQVVWEYMNPVGSRGIFAQGDVAIVNDLFRANKYDLDYPAFDNKILSPFGFIERLPYKLDCQVDSLTTAINEISFNAPEITLFNQQNIQIQQTGNELLEVLLFNSMGRIITQGSSNNQYISLELNEKLIGVYLVVLKNKEGQIVGLKKFILY